MVQQDTQKGNTIMDDMLKDSWAPEGPISKKIKERIQQAGTEQVCGRRHS